MTTKQINFLGLRIDNLTGEEIILAIEEMIEVKKPVQIVGVNVDQVLHTKKHAISNRIFKDAALVFTDGKPIVLMSKLLGTPIKERTTGPDLMEDLCRIAAQKRYSIFLLGAGPGVSDKAAEVLKAKYKGLSVAGTYSPPFGFQKNEMELNKINAMLKDSKADMLFVGMGSPKQDIFIYENKNKYQIPVSFSMGAAIDFIAGNVKRAPRWMIKCGLEWFYRVIQDPKRLWKRYFINDMAIIPLFFHYLLKKE